MKLVPPGDFLVESEVFLWLDVIPIDASNTAFFLVLTIVVIVLLVVVLAVPLA